MITGFARTTAEVSAAMNMTAARARVLVAQAESLDCRLPAVAALLAAGVVDWYTVEIIIARTDFVDDDKCALVDARLAEQISDWCCWSRQRIINAVDYAVNTLDAEAAKRRRAVAFDQRGVTVTAGLDGMARARISMTARAGGFEHAAVRTGQGGLRQRSSDPSAAPGGCVGSAARRAGAGVCVREPTAPAALRSRHPRHP